MKTLHCSDAGFNCEGVIRGKNEDEVMTQAAQHAKEVHGIEVTAEMGNQIKTLIREEEV